MGSLTRFAPQLIVLVIAAYWGWSGLADFLPKGSAPAYQSDAKKANTSQEFSVAALSPRFAPPAKRDPFGETGAKTSRKNVKGQKKGQKSTTETVVVADGASLGLVLSATCILGQQKFAMINGQVYREKETVQTGGTEPTSCVVTSIRPRDVVLSWQGKLLRLDYPGAPPKGDTAKPAPKTSP